VHSLKSLIVGTALLAASQALAHDGKGPNGGRIADAGNYHVELVVGGTDVAVFVSDGNEKPVAPTGFKGLAILNAGGKVQRIALDPQARTLAGKAEAPLPNNVKGVVQLTGPDGKVSQGQFK
jgi:hypothetical protein